MSKKITVNKNLITMTDRRGRAITPQASVNEAYSGAEISRLLNDLPSGDYTNFSLINTNAERLRARARHLERNNDIVRRCLYLVEQNVVGPKGVELVPLAKRTLGGRVEDVRLNEQISALWSIFETENDIRCRYQSLRTALKMAVRRSTVDGETFIELLPGFRNRSRFSFRILDPSHVPVSYTDQKRRINMGIEYDEYWCPVAYYVSDADGEVVHQTGKYRRVPAENMLHYFRRERPYQGRGVTLLASPMQRLHMLDQYEEATLVGARVASSKMGFFYDELGDDSPQPYSGAVASDGEVPVDPETGRPISEEQLVDVAAGQFEDIGTKRFMAFDPGYPPARYDEYTTSILRSISAGLNISYYKLGNDLREVNYSTAREAKLDDTDNWRDQQSSLRDAVLDPLYASWLRVQTLNPTATRLTAEDYDRALPHRWQFRGWSWIDPEKEMRANLMQVQMGLKAPSQIVSEQGGDYVEVIAQIAKDLQLAESAGVDLKTALYGAQVAAPQPNGDENDG